MKCLTICQPYSYLICTPQRDLPAYEQRKRVENRTWYTDYRGPLLIHAGKSRQWMRPGDLEQFPDLVFGAIVGVADLDDCVPFPDMTPPMAAQVRFLYPWIFSHVHAEGPFCWILEKARRFRDPIEYAGKQGLFNVPDDVVQSQL